MPKQKRSIDVLREKDDKGFIKCALDVSHEGPLSQLEKDDSFDDCPSSKGYSRPANAENGENSLQANLLGWLRDADYPSNKWSLINVAKRHGAKESDIELLYWFPPKVYSGQNEVREMIPLAQKARDSYVTRRVSTRVNS